MRLSRVSTTTAKCSLMALVVEFSLHTSFIPRFRNVKRGTTYSAMFLTQTHRCETRYNLLLTAPSDWLGLGLDTPAARMRPSLGFRVWAPLAYYYKTEVRPKVAKNALLKMREHAHASHLRVQARHVTGYTSVTYDNLHLRHLPTYLHACMHSKCVCTHISFDVCIRGHRHRHRHRNRHRSRYENRPRPRDKNADRK